MRIILVAIRDITTDSFGPPSAQSHPATAIRDFQDKIMGQSQHADHMLRTHPEDFELYRLGYYDDQKGEFHNDKEQLISGRQVRDYLRNTKGE